MEKTINKNRYIMKKIQTDKAPNPAGHYTQAIEASGFIFVSGQLGINASHPDDPVGSIEEQTHQVLQNVRAILNAAGTDLNHVVKSTVYISDIALWGTVNTIYSSYFSDHRPARAIVPTRDLHHGYQIEMEVIAVKEL
jgi:2-iminobutanoate/2-iminopropanoate deaminase